MGVGGTITSLGQLIQLATLYSNVAIYDGIGDFGSWLGEATGGRWCADREEEANKPWCHTTHTPRFDRQLEVNILMKPWE